MPSPSFPILIDLTMTPGQEALFQSKIDFARTISKAWPVPNEFEIFSEQEALFALQRAVEKYDSSRGSFEAFAGEVIKNHLKGKTRGKQRSRELPMLDELPSTSAEHETKKDSVPDSGPNPRLETERNEIRRAIEEGLGALTEGQWMLIERRAAGFSFAELAREQGKSEQAIRQMHERGIENLRPELQMRGVVTPQFMPSARSFGDANSQTESSSPIPVSRESENPIRFWGVVVCAVLIILGLLLLVGILF